MGSFSDRQILPISSGQASPNSLTSAAHRQVVRLMDCSVWSVRFRCFPEKDLPGAGPFHVQHGCDYERDSICPYGLLAIG